MLDIALDPGRNESRNDPRVARYSRSMLDSIAVTLGRTNDFALTVRPSILQRRPVKMGSNEGLSVQ